MNVRDDLTAASGDTLLPDWRLSRTLSPVAAHRLSVTKVVATATTSAHKPPAASATELKVRDPSCNMRAGVNVNSQDCALEDGGFEPFFPGLARSEDLGEHCE